MKFKCRLSFVIFLSMFAVLLACGGGSDSDATSAISATATDTTTDGSANTNILPETTIVTPSVSMQNGLVSFTLVVMDAESSSCNLVAEYSADGGATWKTATPGIGSTGLTDLPTSPEGISYTFIWDSTADSIGVDAVEFGVMLRIKVYDGIDYSVYTATDAFIIDNFTNQTPVVTPPAMSGRHEGDITLDYTIADVNGDTCSVVVEYTYNDGANWSTATSAGGDDGITGLVSDASGVAYRFVWDSVADNVGNTYPPHSVKIRFTPSDTRAAGNAAVTTVFGVINLPHGIFVSVGNLNTPCWSYRGVVLDDENIFICGGTLSDGTLTDNAELINTTDFTSTPVGPMATQRGWGPGVTLLPSGKVLITGGYTAGDAIKKVEIFDPATRTITPSANDMLYARIWAVDILLKNGKVTVAGGWNTVDNHIGFVDLYDPVTDTFTAATDMNQKRYYAAGAMLTDGRVLMCSGKTDGGIYQKNAEVYDPVANTWTPVLNDVTIGTYGNRAVRLQSGNVLVLGGAVPGDTEYREADVYDPATNTFTRTADMLDLRYSTAAVLMSSGKVFVAGGESGGLPLNSVDIYDPASGPANGTFTAVGNMGTPRSFHNVYWLPTQGVVVLIGGRVINSNACTSSIQIYYP